MIYAEVKSNGVLNQVWKGVREPYFNPPLLAGSTLVSFPDGTDVKAGMLWDGSQLLPPPPPPIEEVRANASAKILAYARNARARIAGTGDPAKLAEYADKAALAPQIIAGTAPADAVAAAREEALDLGLQDIPSGDTAEVQLARIWEQKAAQLRQARNIVNRMERQARAAVEAAADEAAIEQVLNDYKAQADQALTDLLAQMGSA